MKKKSSFLSTLALLATLSSMHAYVHAFDNKPFSEIGTNHELIISRVKELELSNLSSLEEIIVPVNIISIVDEDFFSAFDIISIQNMIDTANQELASVRIKLQVCGGIKTIKDSERDSLFNSTSDSFSAHPVEREAVQREHGSDDALNLVFVDGFYDPDPGVLLGFASTAGVDNGSYIFLRNRISTDPRLFAHELGHYFSLLHTDFGHQPSAVEDDCYAKGDRICDTPVAPDFDHEKIDPKTCDFKEKTLDKNGIPYTPDYSNIMISEPVYSCVTHSFTQDQLKRMRAGAELFRSDLSCSAGFKIDVYDSHLSNTPENVGACRGKLDQFSYTITPLKDGLTNVKVVFEPEHPLASLDDFLFSFLSPNNAEKGYFSDDVEFDETDNLQQLSGNVRLKKNTSYKLSISSYSEVSGELVVSGRDFYIPSRCTNK